MAQKQALQRTPHSRVWLIDGSAGPFNQPLYQGYARATGVSQSLGDLTPIRVPSATAYDQFDIVETVKGQEDLPSLSVEFRKVRDISQVLRIAKKRCELDVQVHIGACKNPSDFQNGWDIIGILEEASIGNYSTDDLGAFDGDNNSAVTETVDLMGKRYYEVGKLTVQKLADVTITDEIIKVIICDQVQCASCGISSDGCGVIFALVAESSGSPGVGAKIIFSSDAGTTWTSRFVTPMAPSATATGFSCVGPYLVVTVGGAVDTMYVCLISDFIKNTHTWYTVTTGFVAAGSPGYIYSYDATHTWICGDLGYLYTVTDPLAGATARLDGTLTAQPLNAVHSFDGDTVLAGGNANALLLSRNGGLNWGLLTGPSAENANAVRAVFCTGLNTFFVAYSSGTLYATRDGGVTWTQKALPEIVSDVRTIDFSTRSVGYIGVQTGFNLAAVYRTINGGYTWAKIPEDGNSTFPTGRRINSVAACEFDPNLVYAAGLASDLNDGILIKGAA